MNTLFYLYALSSFFFITFAAQRQENKQTIAFMKLRFRLLLTSILLTANLVGVCAQDSEAQVPRRARQNVLAGAKNLTLTTTKGITYYYLVSTEQMPVLHLGDSLRIGKDRFAYKDVQSMRFRSLARMVMDEDSTTFDKTRTMDHSLLALRRHFQVGKWNSLVLPFDLTGEQILDAFGEDADLAAIRGIREADETVVEFQKQELHTSEVVLQANQHYLLRPSREADVEEDHSLYNFLKSGVPGPIYLIPNVTMKANQNPRLHSLSNNDGTRKVRIRGTYLKLDDSVIVNRIVRNRRIGPGVFLLDEEGLLQLTEDSTTVGAFRSWVENLSDDGQPLKFYIDGIGEYLTVVTDGIEEVLEPISPSEGIKDDGAVYDLSGRRMPAGRLPKGIYIINGKKVAIKQ